MTKLKFITLLISCTFSVFGQDTIPKNKEINILKCRPSIIDESKSPIVLVNGNIGNYEMLEKIDTQNIKNITILKRDSSSIFRHNSAEGVIIITTKNISKKKLKKLYKL